MFHICFYLRLDIVYVYVMPRPPSIETIPGAPLDQAKIGKTNGTNRKKRRRKGSQQKLSQERHESKKGNKRKTRENR